MAEQVLAAVHTMTGATELRECAAPGIPDAEATVRAGLAWEWPPGARVPSSRTGHRRAAP